MTLAEKVARKGERETARKWQKLFAENLVGKTITSVRYMTDSEMEEWGWHSKALIIELDDDNWLLPMRDDEGNDAGAIACSFENLPTIPVI